MQTEPTINRPALIAAVRDHFKVTLDTLTFVPFGFAAVCYTARADDGTAYFLKLWSQAAPGSPAAAHLAAVLRLQRALAERHVMTHLPVPYPSRTGDLLAHFGAATLALFPLLGGSVPPEPLSADVQSTWARTIAHLHRATPRLHDVIPAHERFEVPFEAELHTHLDHLEERKTLERSALHALRALVVPHRNEIEQQLARLHTLQHRVRRLPGPKVLCHTDAGTQNLLVDGRRLYVVDWDDATLAPPEHDLHEARFMDLARIYEQYTAAGGEPQLWLDHFAFYLLRRHLGDMTARVRRVLDATTADDGDALDGIQRWSIDQWRALDDTLEQIRDALGTAVA